MSWKGSKEHSIDGIFLVFIFMVFAFSAIASLVLAVRFYQDTTYKADSNSSARVAVAYVREALHQNDMADTVSMTEFDGIPCICMSMDQEYERRLYFYDGKLMELYVKNGADISPADGQEIMELKAMEMTEVKAGTYRISCEDAYQQKLTEVVTVKTNRSK